MKKLCVYAILLMGLMGGAAYAQIPGTQNDTLPDGYLREHLALPAEIRALLQANKAKEAVAAYEKFKKTAQADDLDMLMLDTEVYGSASFMEPSADYGKMREDAVKKMLEKYPNNAEVLMYAMPEDGNKDKILEVLNKMIEADPEYLPAYEQRFQIYKERNMAKEACMDYMKLPESIKARMGSLTWDCESLIEEAENGQE